MCAVSVYINMQSNFIAAIPLVATTLTKSFITGMPHMRHCSTEM